MNGSRKDLGVALRKVLLRKDDHGIVENKNGVQGTFFRALAFVMNDFCFGKVDHLIATLLDAIR